MEGNTHLRPAQREDRIVKVTVASRKIVIGKSLRKDIRDRIYFAMSRYSPRIEAVTVRIEDVNEARSGSETLCRMSVRIKGIGSFAVESVDDEMSVAVSRAARQAASRILRLLDRQREQGHSL